MFSGLVSVGVSSAAGHFAGMSVEVRPDATAELGDADFQGVCVFSAQVIDTKVPGKVCSATAEGQICSGVGRTEI